jgi:hypothetical protein
MALAGQARIQLPRFFYSFKVCLASGAAHQSIGALTTVAAAFLMDLDDAGGHDLSKLLPKVPEAVRNSLKFSCPKCPHTAANPWPPIPTDSNVAVPSCSDSASLQDTPTAPSALPESTESEQVAPATTDPESAVETDLELICFHSKRTYHEECLGIPLTVTRTGTYVIDSQCVARSLSLSVSPRCDW